MLFELMKSIEFFDRIIMKLYISAITKVRIMQSVANNDQNVISNSYLIGEVFT